MKDLIDEKNRQEKMKRSIIKYWNVSYGSPEAIGGEEEEKELWGLVKAADKLSALIKCLQERRAGNMEFLQAEKTLRRSIEEMKIPEAQVFLKEFLPAFCLTLDELDAVPEKGNENEPRENLEKKQPLMG